MMRTRCIIVLAFCAALFVYSFPRESGDNLGLLVRSRDLDLAPLSDAHEDMMEQIWSNCKLDLFGTNSIMGVVNEYIADQNAGDSTKFDLKKLPFLRANLQNAIIKLPSDIRYPLIDCLMDQILLFPRNRYSRRPARLFDQSTLSIKHLAGQSVNNLFSSVFPAAVLTPLRRNLVSETNLVTLGGLNSNTLQPSSEAPAPENDPENLSPAPISGGYLAPEDNNPSPKHAVAPSEQKSNNTKTIIIAVVVTATVTLTLAALCFCCFYRYLRNKYQFDNGQRDERPLLSLSDISVSSHMAFGQANSFHNDKNGSLPLKADPNRNVQALPLDSLSNSQLDAAYSIVSSTVDPTKAPNHATEPAPPPLPTMKGPPVSMVSTIPPAPPPSLTNPMPPPAPPVGGPPPPKGGPPLPKHTPPPKGGPPLPKVGPPRPPQASSSSSTVPLATSRISANTFDSDGSKTKLKPFFWDKVMTNPDQSMVWHRIKSGSFHFNEEMIESLFGYNAADKSWNDAKKDMVSDPSARRIQILDPKKSQNLAISLRAWNVKVEEVCDALMEGNELPVDLLQALLRMAPTSDEELKLKLFNDNTALLGPAEQFLKAIVNIPFAFKRMDALLLMTTLQEESTFVKESLSTIEEACKELRNSRLFLKLLEAVLKTGNRMNDGTFRGGAQAFKLDTLLKLSDVKGADGKTTLLHFVVQEIIRSEGRRAVHIARENRSNSNISISSSNSKELSEELPEQSEDLYRTLGLKAVSCMSSELENVKNAAGLDADALTITVAGLGHRLVKTKEFLNTDMRNLMEESSFHDSLKAFVEHAEADITYLLEEEKRVRLLVKNTTDYFHGSAGRDEGLRLFVIVRDFMGMVDKACKVVRETPKKVIKRLENKDNPTLQPIPEPRRMLFPTIKEQHMDDFSSDEEGS
ncbi:formin-like protein 5 [Phalaenopsis equestris]|uniref:formin-like protein 5 n=1 Tax=Phalaenopsis equestris TaxID=78828 RepID=UPI0009E2C27F|nr:formin-like protein 5 [Phalaenopsis equestris]